MKKRLTMILAGLFLMIGMASAQKQVTGVVVDEFDEPVMGATVKVVGTNALTLTDTNGNFSIQAPSDKSSLSISYIGYLTQTVKAGSNLHISLQVDRQTLDEVMVVAYGTAKKSSFTGSAAVVGADEISKVQVTNAADALKGKAAGVQIYNATGQPGSVPTIRVRGFNSLNAGNAPLLVVDGSPYDGSLNDINPIDIESLTVLKDAASTALYGARGGNGVILITTKNAKKGKDATITVDAKWGANHRATPDYEMINSPAKYYEMWYQGLYNYAVDSYGYSANQAWQFANSNLTRDNAYGLGYNVYTVPAGQSLIGTNGKLNPNATLGNVISYGGEEYTLLPDDWTAATYKTSLRKEYTVSASGANDRGSFYASVNYLDNEGITPQSNYERMTARVNSEYQLKSWLKVGMNVNYGHYNRDVVDGDGDSGSTGNMFAMTTIAPIYPLYVRDGQGNIIYNQAAHINTYDYGDGSIIGISRKFLAGGNQLASAQLDRNHVQGNTFNGTATMDISLPFDLKLSTISNYYLRESRSVSTTNSYFGMYAVNGGSIDVDHDRIWSTNQQQRLSWHKIVGKHDIDAMIAHEYYRLTSSDLWGSRSKMFADNYYELSGAVKVDNTNSSSSVYNTESFLGRLMYNFDNRYFAQLSYVREASSAFDADHRWGNFWSASVGWNINKEKWFKADWVDELKLKVSYGENGNDDVAAFRYITYYNIVNSNDEVSLTPAAYGNKRLSWEKNAKFNAGLDFSLWNGRLEGGVEFYANRTTDMIQAIPLPYTFGYTSYLDNIGNMENRGIEANLRGDIIRTKAFTWSAYANVTSNHNEVTKLTETAKRMYIGGGYMGNYSGNYLKAEGLSAWTFYMPKYAGVDPDTGKSLWYKEVWAQDSEGNYLKNPDGTYVVTEVVKTDQYSDATEFACKDALPDVYGGFGTSFEWKGIDLSLDFTYQLGGYVYDSTYASLMGSSAGQAMHVDLLNAWSANNLNSLIPRWQYNDSRMNAQSDRFLTSASYLTLQNVTVGYTLPKALTTRWGINKLRLYCVADNIWTWSHRQGLDPRQSITGGSSSAYYSSVRTISGGITVTF